MNNSFEYQYKKFAAKDAPDLWNRIESSIDAGMLPSENTAATPKKGIPFYKKYGGLLAACACIFILVPTVMIGIRLNQSSLHSEKALDAGMEQSAAQDLAESSAEDAAENLAEAPAIDAAENPAEAPATEMTGNLAAVSEEKEVAADSLSLIDGTALRSLRMVIEENNAGIYTASVLEDPNGYFKAGDLISFTKDSYLKLNFELGCSYTMTLNYYTDEAVPLEAIRAEKNN